jgi:hypothetical protein
MVTTRTRALQRAAEVLSGDKALQKFLDVSTPELTAWRQGSVDAPPEVFFKVMALLADRDVKSLSGPNH